MTGRLILLRHGQTYSNLNRVLDTRPPGAELTDLGKEQARTVGFELAEYCGVGNRSLGRVAAVVSSVAIRAQQTAVRVVASMEEVAGLPAGSTPIEIRLGIHEIYAGTLEGHQGEEAAAAYTEVFRGWLGADPDSRLEGGENHEDVLLRYRPVLESLVEDYLQEDVDVIVVTHGAAIRTMARHATNIDADFAFGAYVPNCRFVVLEPGGRPFGEWSVVRWADTAHQL